MAWFFVVSAFILWLMQVTVGAWLFASFPSLGWKLPVVVLPALLSVGMFAGLSYTQTHWGGFAPVIYYASYAWMGLAFLAFCICAVCAVLAGVLGMLHLPARVWLGPLSVGLMAVVFALSIYGGISAPRLKRISVSVPGMPKMKLALLSDSHLGMGVSYTRFDRAMARLQQEQPDALLVLGDVFEFGPHREKSAARIKNFVAPQGIYGVFGNHEYYAGYENSKDFFEQSGITLLENALTQMPSGVQVAGIKDAHTAHVTSAAVDALLAQASADKPLIFLSHTPVFAETAAKHGANLMFSGHTHNGQIYPFNYLVKLQFPRVYGLFQVEQMKFYITSGMFYWGVPLRFLAPSEIPVIEVNY